MKLVEVVPYDPTWPSLYEKEAGRVAEALGGVAIAVEHIGSTAVPGLAAKPTLDILVGAGDLIEIDSAVETLMESAGYEPRGEMGVPGRRYFRKGESFPREANVHIVEFGGGLWRKYLAFRDYLRDHPEEAGEYGSLKLELAASPESAELDAYAAGKATFIAAIERRTNSAGKA